MRTVVYCFFFLMVRLPPRSPPTDPPFPYPTVFRSDNRLRDGSYTLVDASVGWKSTDGTYGLRVWGKNLTDSYHYAQVFSQAFTADIGSAAGPPRTYGVTAELHF